MLQVYFYIGSSFYNQIEIEWGHTWHIDGKTQGIVWSETEAQARARMLIHLLELKLITASDVSNRLINS